MTLQTEGPRQGLSDDKVDALMAQVEKSQQLAEHFPDEEALDRAHRILTGEISLDDALAEIDSQYAE